MMLELTSAANTTLSLAASPRVIVPPSNVTAPTKVEIPETLKLFAISTSLGRPMVTVLLVTAVLTSFAVPANVNVSPVLKVSLPLSPATVKLDAAGAENERTPLPFVVRIYPLLPSALGSVKVVIPARESAAFSVI